MVSHDIFECRVAGEDLIGLTSPRNTGGSFCVYTLRDSRPPMYASSWSLSAVMTRSVTSGYCTTMVTRKVRDGCAQAGCALRQAGSPLAMSVIWPARFAG